MSFSSTEAGPPVESTQEKGGLHDKKRYVVPNLFRNLEFANDDELIALVLVRPTGVTSPDSPQARKKRTISLPSSEYR